LVDSLVLDELAEGDKELLKASLKEYHSAKDDTSKVNALDVICDNMMHEDWIKYQFFQYNLILKKLKTQSSKTIIKQLKISLSSALNNIGLIYKQQGDFPLALEYYNKALEIRKDIGDTLGISFSYHNIGNIHKNQGDIPLALEYFAKSLKIKEEAGDKLGIASSYNSIGNVHGDQGDIPLALEYFAKSLKIREEIGDKRGIAFSHNNIGNFQEAKGEFSLALEHFTKALIIRKEIGKKSEIAQSYNSIGLIHGKQGNFPLSLEYFTKALEIREKINDKSSMANSYHNIGYLYYKQGNTSLALKYELKAFALVKKIGFPNGIKSTTNLLSKIYEAQGKGMEALEMYKLHIQMKDSMNNEATQKATAQQQAKYEYEKQKAIDDAQHDKLLAIEQEEKEKQQILTGATAGGLGLVVVFLIFVFNRLRVTKKQKHIIEIQKQEVEQQKEVVELAHSELEEKNQEIMDSITYAKRIQSAILPTAKVVKEYLQESFILYKPKDIVAGDFYWMESVAPTGENKETTVLFAAADCTGHGVPGAMVSVVCNNALNRSVREHGLSTPGEILTKTREIVIQEFEKSEEDVKDGMDIALCSLEGNQLEYAGAHNPLWLIRNGEIIETKANKQPIGQFDNPEPYTTHSFELQQGDAIYIFSDGYVDQFGGEKGKKFKAKAFRELLLSVQEKSMEEQKTIIDEAFETWRGNLEQIDDVCVIGVRV
jgi:serine phosphatase RsbU (regulator of sigma subunit)/Tfp pilus assembly protein PilF